MDGMSIMLGRLGWVACMWIRDDQKKNGPNQILTLDIGASKFGHLKGDSAILLFISILGNHQMLHTSCGLFIINYINPEREK